MNFNKFSLGEVPECQKVFFHKTSFVCFQGGTQHYHAVLGADLGIRDCCAWVAEGILSGLSTPFLGPANFVASILLQQTPHNLRIE